MPTLLIASVKSLISKIQDFGFFELSTMEKYFPFFQGYLRPSRELLEYYRKKIAEYDEEHESLVSKLEEYRVTYEEQVQYRP